MTAAAEEARERRRRSVREAVRRQRQKKRAQRDARRDAMARSADRARAYRDRKRNQKRNQPRFDWASRRVVGTAKTYGELVDLIKAYRRARGISQIEMDELVGWPSGYCAKIECSPTAANYRRLTNETLPWLLEVLGLELVIVEKPGGARPGSGSHSAGAGSGSAAGVRCA